MLMVMRIMMKALKMKTMTDCYVEQIVISQWPDLHLALGIEYIK